MVWRLGERPESERSLAAIIDGFYRFHGEVLGRTFTRWGDKSPVNCEHWREILSVFPDARFVLILRDPADSIASLVRSGLQPDVPAAATRWLRAYEPLRRLAAKHPKKCREVRYERLVGETGGVIQEVCRHLDLRYRPGMEESTGRPEDMTDLDAGIYRHLRNVENPVTTESIGKGRRSLSEADRRHAQNRLGRILSELGYEPLI